MKSSWRARTHSKLVDWRRLASQWHLELKVLTGSLGPGCRDNLPQVQLDVPEDKMIEDGDTYSDRQNDALALKKHFFANIRQVQGL